MALLDLGQCGKALGGRGQQRAKALGVLLRLGNLLGELGRGGLLALDLGQVPELRVHFGVLVRLAGNRELEHLMGVQLGGGKQQVGVAQGVLHLLRRGLLEQARGFLVAVGTGDAGEVQVLDVGHALPTVAPFLLPELVTVLRREYPMLRLLLREDTTAHLLQRLDDGRLDMVVLALPYDLGDRRVEPLFLDPLLLVSAPDRPAADKVRLDANRLLLLEEGHCLRGHTVVACGLASSHAVPSGPSPIEASSLLTLVEMVAGGIGDALVPEMALDLLRRAGLQPHRLEPCPSRGIALVARTTWTRLAAMAAIAAVLRAKRGDGSGIFAGASALNATAESL